VTEPLASEDSDSVEEDSAEEDSAKEDSAKDDSVEEESVEEDSSTTLGAALNHSIFVAYVAVLVSLLA